jgi:hypothetical protein
MRSLMTNEVRKARQVSIQEVVESEAAITAVTNVML